MKSISYEQFLKIKNEFSLGNLTTESTHPKTKNLSNVLKQSTEEAIKILSSVDNDLFKEAYKFKKQIFETYLKLEEVRKNNGRIFLCGCGATGRLSLSIETIARKMGITDIYSFMAGGDYALIKSVESFEDRMSYGARQLLELGFNKNDALLAITEGGETSFVIGAAMESSKLTNNTFFLYCNPDSELKGIERCDKIFENNNISCLNLTIGPMALSGSTRMQATTIQMFATGLISLYEYNSFEDFSFKYEQYLNELSSLDYSFLKDFINKESEIYKDNGIVTYLASSSIGIAVLTDTTERAPTFSLEGFESTHETERTSLSYLTLKGTTDTKDAWLKLLSRSPREVNWAGLDRDISLEAIYGFDISENSIERRREEVVNHNIFTIENRVSELLFSLGESTYRLFLNNTDLLFTHLILKVLLNTHSTLVMGKLGRFESNIMTYVLPSNYKLIDRATRYALELLKDNGIEKNYDEIAKEVIEYSTSPNQLKPVVLHILEKELN